METERRGIRPLVAVVCAIALVACSGDALHVMGDAAVDIGEAMRDASCALAQDDSGACVPVEPAHGSIDVVCDQVATWTQMGVEETIRFGLVTPPTRAVQVERCHAFLDQCSDVNFPCSGSPPPAVTCASTGEVTWSGDQLRVRCDNAAPTTYRVVW